MDRADDTSALVSLLRDMADKLEKEDHGSLTGVVLVVTAVPGVFAEDAPMTGVWVSMQGGRQLYGGLLSAAADVAGLRDFKKGQTQ